MKYLKKYEDHINEEFIGSLLAAAKGVFKNFLTALAAPFKELKEDFKKGLKRDELRNKINVMLDKILKASLDNIDKAEDEQAITNIKEAFQKELDEKIIELDKEVSIVKESLIVEGVVQDSLIGGRVLLNVVKSKIEEIKAEYDKKYADAKDINEKKATASEWIKKVIEDSKKKMTDEKYIDNLISKYKTDKNIKSVQYKIGDTVIYLRKNRTKAEWDGLPDNVKLDPEKTGIVSVKQITGIEGSNYIFIGKDNKKIVKTIADIISKKDNPDTPETTGLKDKLGKIKDDTTKMGRIDKFVDFMNKEENKDKIDQIDKIIGGDNDTKESSEDI